MEITATNENFAEIISANKLVLVDFWATWCGPCKKVGPYVEQLAEEYADKAIIGKVDVDENQDLPMQFGVRNIPTILFIKDGQVVDKQIGAVAKNILEDKLKAIL